MASPYGAAGGPEQTDRNTMNTKRRTIAVFTGNRAEYGLQMPILRAIADHPDLDYKLIVSGAHLDPHFGRTLAEIEADGFTVAAEVAIDMPGDTLYATAHAIGSGILSLAIHSIASVPTSWWSMPIVLKDLPPSSRVPRWASPPPISKAAT